MQTTAGDVIEEQFQVGVHPELTVSNVAGRISVRAGDDGLIWMRATKSGSSRAKEHTRVEITHTGNHVNIQTRSEPRDFLGIVRSTCAVLYEIVVPRECEVRARGVGSEIELSGLQAPTSVQTVSGDVSVRDVTGDCSIITVSGDATGHRINGALTLRTTSGDADIRDSTLPHFNINTVSGDFSIETPLAPASQYLGKTVSGDLHVIVPPGTGATVQMKSVSGDAVSELPADIIKSGRRHWQGRINGGGASLEMSSVSGDLRVSQSARGGTAPPARQEPAREPSTAPDVPPPSQEQSQNAGETSAILAALERGEITVEEAMARLDALR